MSCATAGECSAGGTYVDSSNRLQAFVVNQANGQWGRAKTVAAALNTGGRAEVNSISCASAGNCSAGGGYVGGRYFHAFVVTETDGSWGTATQVTGPFDPGEVNSVSCASAGNCSAGGYPNRPNQPGFVVNETDGIWGKATRVAASLGYSDVDSVSCASAGDCSAGGYYLNSFDQQGAFVVNEANGIWGRAKKVAANRTSGGDAQVDSVSCGSAGDCSAGGYYTISSGRRQAFVVNEVNGTWGTVKEVAGTLNASGGAQVNSVSCASAGNCSAGGSYVNNSTRTFAFVVDEVSGIWGKANRVAAARGPGQIYSVSCASAGNCSAGGYYYDSSFNQRAFVIDEINGTWGPAQEIAAALDVDGDAQIDAVSCAASGTCGAGGYYSDSSRAQQAFVVSKP